MVGQLVSSSRRLILFSYKHRIRSLKVLYPGPAETIKTLRRWTQPNISTLQVFQSFSHQCKSLFFQFFPKIVIRFLYEYILNLLKANLQSTRRHHVTNFENEVQIFSLKGIKNTWEQRRDVLESQKGLQLVKVVTLPVNNHLFRYEAVCSRPCFCIQQQQELEYSGNYKAGASKVSSLTKSHVPNSFV